MLEEYGKTYVPKLHLPMGLLIAIGYVAILLWTADMGFCRDEGYYFRASRYYITWVEELGHQLLSGQPLRALERREIERYWRYNNEHPPLAKLAMGASWWLFSKKLGWMSNSTGFRFPGMLWAALMVFIVFIWGTQVWNVRVGLFAAFALMLLPRFFFHAHLAAFDVPISALWLLVVYAFWRSMTDRVWALWCGLFFGLALATKHNSWILPAPLGLYWLAQSWNKFRVTIMRGDIFQIRFPALPNALFASLIIGPIVLFLSWPLLWPEHLLQWDSWRRTTFYWLKTYVGFHLHHVNYDAYYFGVLHLEPPFPWNFPFGMTIITFPLVTVVLIFGGLWFIIRQQRIGTHLLWWLYLLVVSILSFLKRIVVLVLSLSLFIPAFFLLILSMGLLLIEGVGFLLPGGLGVKVRERLAWTRSVFHDLQGDLMKWNHWDLAHSEKEYRPRPVGPVDKTGFLWLLNAFIPIFIIALPSTPIFGGTKHWMPAWPFLALFAGVAFERMWVFLQRRSSSQTTAQKKISLQLALGLFLLLPAFIGLVRSHPHGLAYYNTLIGGPRGSANWKLQRAFWASTMRQALPWMNEHLKSQYNDTKNPVYVHFHDTNYDAYLMYREDKLIHPRIRATWHPYKPTRYIAFIHQKWLRTQLYHALSVLDSRAPVYGIYLDDVPLLTIWEAHTTAPSLRW